MLGRQQHFVTFPGNLNFSVLRGASRGQFPPMWRLPSRYPAIFRKNGHFVGFTRDTEGAESAARWPGACLSGQTVVCEGKGGGMSYLL